MRLALALPVVRVDGSPARLDEDASGEIYSAIVDVVEEHLERVLTRPAEVTVFEALGAGVLEPDCQPAQDAVALLFNTHYAIGGDAGYHWYELAIAQRRDAIDERLAALGFALAHLREAPEALARRPSDEPTLMVVQDTLLYLRRDGTIEDPTDGWEPIVPTADDRALAARLGPTGLCYCELCLKLRGEPVR